MTRLRLPVAALLCLISSSAWADLRTYDVDSQYRQEIYAALRQLLDNAGRVELLPTGQIVVNAQPETLDQVEQLLRAIRERPQAATPRVTLRYWVVVGTRGASNETTRTGGQQTIVTVVPNAPNGGPPPAVLNGVLAELQRFHGDLTFRVIGTAAVISQSGEPGGIEGVPLRVAQRAHVQGDTLNAEISMKLSLPVTWNNVPQDVAELEVQTSLKRGEFVVLGEGTQQGSGVDGTLFYIVHWPE